MALDVATDVLEDEPELNTTINTTPLVDVMLVLLVVFLVTIPVFIRTVPVHLPNARNIVRPIPISSGRATPWWLT